MNERVRSILTQIKDWWAGFNKKQKTIFVSSAVIVVLLIVLVAWILSIPKWEPLKTCANYTEVSEIQALLTENGIEYNIGDDALSISVKKDDLVNAKIILGSNNIQASGYSLEDALNGSFTTTEADKTRKYKAYMESKLAEELSSNSSIKKAYVTISFPESSSIITSSTEDTSVAVVLVLKQDLEEGVGENLAQWLKTAVGNKSTEKITIISSTGSSIYSGENSASNTINGSLVTQQKYALQISNTIKGSIRNTLLKIPMYDEVQISLNLDIDFDEVQEIVHKYEVQEGRDEGVLSESYEEVSTGSTGVGGTPGTESNDNDTTYYIQNADGSVSEHKVIKYAYLPNEIVTTTNKNPGEIVKANSTITVVLHDNIVYNYAEVKAAGHLDDMTWDEFKAANGKYQVLEVDDKIKEAIAFGTGLDVANVSVLAYSVPYFVDEEVKTSNSSFWIKVALVGGIVLLLLFVVFRSSSPITVQETEPELSVEEMLATTKEKQNQSVEDIDLQDKSEIRVAIEKFVDESPEAVALLLRNWLDDGWD